MRALLFAHVDQLGCFLNSAKGRFHRRLRTANKSHDRAIGGRARIDIEQRNSID